jgi:hypothetical protein
VIRRRLPSENTFGPVTLIGESLDDFRFLSAQLAQKTCPRLGLKSNAIHTVRVWTTESCGLASALAS